MLPRILALILLAMNVGVAAWWLIRPLPPAPALPEARDPETPSLTLLLEREAENAGDEGMGIPPMAVAEPGVCYEIGPFLTQIDLRRVLRALTPAVNRIQFRQTNEVIRRGYRVFLPSTGDREQALALARRLSQSGVSDYYVVTAGEEQNTISLGLYREQSNASTRQAQIQALGFAAEIEPRQEELAKFWIDMEVAPGVDWRPRMGGYAGVAADEVDCPAPTTSP
ncbi:SPOR domain-containing protein [Pseudomarimonas arenosa]|uniref:SPOR domain-containing protein n=1 Tax=Pseudomarimonas arenosa TaxID=2774145 RepID=A0AAW3ZR45_9GAMM|nr:SPOR domain-containing protein [Pseudomarimonas arenosa]MBD8527944.1 SPOR domain-containing protein [Pseudomarimonas arenosa]